MLQNDIFLSVALTRHFNFLTWNLYVRLNFFLIKCSWESKSLQFLRKKFQDPMARAVFDICSSSPKPLHHRGFADDQGFDLKASYIATTLYENVRWMGSHLQDWIDYNGVAFSTELLEWGRIFSDFGGKKALHNYGWQTYQNVCTVGDKLSVLHSI